MYVHRLAEKAVLKLFKKIFLFKDKKKILSRSDEAHLENV